MTNEQKDNLTGLCRIEIKRWKAASESNPNMRYMVELMELALAALTAQPIAIVEPRDYLTAAQLVGDEAMSIAVRPLFEGALALGQKLYTTPPAHTLPQ